MTETRELIKYEGRSLVEIKIDGKIKKYVVCNNYDPSKEYGNQWDAGRYFDVGNLIYHSDKDVWESATAENMLKKAVMSLYDIEPEPSISYKRMTEIAQQAVGNLMYHLDKEDIIPILREHMGITETEAERFDVKEELYPQRYKVVEVTLTRKETAVVSVVIPDEENTDYVEGYIDYSSVCSQESDDWEVYDTEVLDSNLTQEEVENGYDYINSDFFSR